MLVFLTAFAAIQDAAALCSHDLAERGLAESQQFERAVTAHLRKRQNVPSPAGNTSSSIIGNWPDVAKLQWSNEGMSKLLDLHRVSEVAEIAVQTLPRNVQCTVLTTSQRSAVNIRETDLPRSTRAID